MKKLSSDVVILHRWFAPFFFGFLTVLSFIGLSFGLMKGDHGQVAAWYEKWIALVVGGIVTGSVIYQAMHILDVELHEEKIKVSGLMGSEEICLREIESISETRLNRPKMVIIHLDMNTKFGKTLKFIPRGTGEFLGTHPIVTELSAAVKKAKAR